jgi:large subunit ribosomal protein L6e
MPAKAKPTKTVNPHREAASAPLGHGVPRYGARVKKGVFAVIKNPNKQAKKIEKPTKTTSQTKTFGNKKPSQRVVEEKFAKYFPLVRVPKRNPKTHNAPKLRASITKGTVVILLAGRFAGKRVIVLDQLQPSGLLLVTGPYKVNGVPLRRVSQRYVIATSTKVDVSGVKVPEQVNDSLWAKKKDSKKDKAEKSQEKFFGKKQQKQLSEEFVQWQQQVDSALEKVIDNVPNLRDYLRTRFSLSNGQYPHAMKF